MTDTYRLPEIIETGRYRMRRVRADDARAIYDSYATDPLVTRHIGWRPHADPAETAAFVGAVAREWDSGGGFPLVVAPRSDPSDLVGMIHPRVREHAVSYGYVLARRVWGAGCATEILSRLVDHALAHPAVCRAEAFCDVDNRASARVMEKAGMEREGLLRRWFVHPNVSELPRDCLMYAKVR